MDSQREKKPDEVLIKISQSQEKYHDKTQNSFDAKVKYWQFLKYQIKKFLRLTLTPKEIYINEAMQRFNFEMDVLNILEQLKEIDNLKNIIFDPLQKKMFNSIAREKIKINLSPKKKIRQTIMEEREDLIRFYDEIEEKKVNEIDQRLYNSLKSI